MVFFTCAHCGESLKKNKVDNHYQTFCSRNPVAVTCIDCCKDFSAETYPAHTKCVSEEEKYSGKGFVPRSSANKGEYKQKKWQDIVKSLHKNHNDLSRDERIIINAIAKYENVPRKKPKFQNFLRSFMKGHYSVEAADSIFDKLEALCKEDELKNKQDNQQQTEDSSAVHDENGETGNDDNPSQEGQVEEKLSKKERKERRKRTKYEAELKEIEGDEVTHAEFEGENDGELRKEIISKQGVTALSTENETAEQGKSKKKHKANIKGAQDGISEDTETTEGGRSKKKHKQAKTVTKNGISEIGDSQVPEGGIPKKKRKKGQDIEDICGEQLAKKKVKRNDTEDVAEGNAAHTSAGKTKFNWQEVIIQVLNSKECKEMPLKRLQKKVLAEFEATGCGSATDVKNIAKFNKKVNQTRGVVVRKELAKLSLN